MIDDPNADGFDVEASMAEANRIFAEAGWTTTLKPPWCGSHCLPGAVGGRSPSGAPYVKAFSAFPQSAAAGFDLDPADYPDTHHEAAAWLVGHVAPAAKRYRFRRKAPVSAAEAEAIASVQSLFGESAEAAYGGEDETHGETGEAATDLHDYARADSIPTDAGQSGDVATGGESEDGRAGMGEGSTGHGGAAGVPEPDWGGGGDGDLPEAPIDADFAPVEDEPPERDALDADLIPLRGIAWDENTVADELGAEILDEGQAPQDRFIGLDDLDRRRSLRIGDVVRVSRAKQEAIWAASGTTEDAYQDLVSAVMRDTINGVYTGPATQFDQFTALQAWANQAHAVARAERGFVAYLTDATREQVESFNPEAGWPE